MRFITTHKDGHQLADDIIISACDEPGPGGAHHEYEVSNAGNLCATIQYQKGGRGEPKSIPGVTDQAMLAIVLDRLKSFQAGAYPCRENAIIITKIEECLMWYRSRADERAARGVLGQEKK